MSVQFKKELCLCLFEYFCNARVVANPSSRGEILFSFSYLLLPYLTARTQHLSNTESFYLLFAIARVQNSVFYFLMLLFLIIPKIAHKLAESLPCKICNIYMQVCSKLVTILHYKLSVSLINIFHSK